MPVAHKSDLPPLTEAEQLAFFERGMERFEEAARRRGRIDVDLEVALTRVRLRFAGDRLLPRLTRALSHLVVSDGAEPDVTFHIWDSESTGVEMVPPPCASDGYTDRGDIWGMASARVKSAFHWSEYAVNLLDLETASAMYWVRSSAGLPYWTDAAPLRTLFHWWIERNGGQLLHAAAVGDERGALLITGKGGIGKSTTALASLACGLKYVADDYLVVRLDPEPRAYSLYGTAKLDPAQVERFPELGPLVTNAATPDDEKAVLQLYPALAGQVMRALPIRAVATPSFADVAETTFAPTSTLALQRAATFTTMSQLPHAGRHTYDFIHRLVERLPGLEMRLGRDVRRVPVAIRELLALPDESLAGLARREEDTRGERRPLVTVIVPLYNGAHFLEDAVASVLAQRYPALEIIVVDDGSTDDVASVVRRLPVDVRFFRRENLGPAAARNQGIRDASGELIAFLDVDDLWPERNLELLVERMLLDPELDVVHGVAQQVRHQPGGTAATGQYVGNPGEAFPFYIGAGLYRRRAFETVGLFDAGLRFGEDSDWFTRAAERGIRIERLDAITLFVRRHDSNMTRDKSLSELQLLRLLKKGIDRRRMQENPA